MTDSQNLVGAIVKEAKRLGWSVIADDEFLPIDLNFSRRSPAGQDFFFDIQSEVATPEDFLQKMRAYYENYDPDEETMKWVDDSGHGINGAPYRLSDVLKDMEWCKNRVATLYNGLCRQLNSIKK